MVMKKVYKMRLILIICIWTSLTIILAGCSNKGKASINANDKLKTLKLSDSDKACCINLNVYFDASKSEDKVQVLKEERIIKKEELLGELIMQELIKGPSKNSNLKPIFPTETKLLSFSINENIAYINLSPNAQYKMTPSREKACLEGIVLSLTQIESIHKVKILINNKDVEFLGGNYDVSKPFGKDDISKIKK
ncbi:GerMN domain-containing protein [Clostridium botulinum C]|uniref:GerMN domain-containing protein n=3 Tax=Clostridium botulinum TaxID=1491 RepID=A0A9Q4TKX7_CLOBO|nr:MULTISPECIES: GerMN domain-containing protein [Clostridium]MCD3195095.1 GerMN domain-containing protein [Clostridium botulinum C]MCD3200435.1 GerMN domain-containing protein [Clostridium botulinum C]MCD3205853.1 GerMN domain-containing protein [Clostridium botulinum C]MCD3208242.1 GerMN domain-containing protein [Clostridium botulinum C]MCD3224112.1 GerMN domain-containing protein [Clostridium botulinum C]